jgi:hypothetical protein
MNTISMNYTKMKKSSVKCGKFDRTSTTAIEKTGRLVLL